MRLTAQYNPALQAIPALGQVGVLALGGWMALRGDITLGTFLAFSSYLSPLVGPGPDRSPRWSPSARRRGPA